MSAPLDAISTKIFLPGIDGTASSDGTNGDAEKAYENNEAPPSELAAQNGVTEAREAFDYGGNQGSWSRADAYENNEYAYEVARNALAKYTSGSNPFSDGEFNKKLQQQNALYNDTIVAEVLFYNA